MSTPQPPYGEPFEQHQPPPPPPGYGPGHGPGPGYGYGPSQGSGAVPPGGYAVSQSERTWGGAAHWSALVAAWVALAFLGPLVVYFVKRDESPYVRQQAAESLNFQLSIIIYGLISAVLCLVLIGFLLLAVVGIVWLVFTIIGSIKASQGQLYRYPLTIRMIS